MYVIPPLLSAARLNVVRTIKGEHAQQLFLQDTSQEGRYCKPSEGVRCRSRPYSLPTWLVILTSADKNGPSRAIGVVYVWDIVPTSLFCAKISKASRKYKFQLRIPAREDCRIRFKRNVDIPTWEGKYKGCRVQVMWEVSMGMVSHFRMAL